MINYWWVTRPKRKLNSIPEVLSAYAKLSLDQEWLGQRDSHLSLEEALEQAGLKRIGERRDQTGGGGRTYAAWLESLGLIFTQASTKQIKLTLAGEAIMNGDSPVNVLKNQVLKYQFPSSFSMSRGVNVSPRFKIRPFRFLLKLLSEAQLDCYLTKEEIGKIVIVEAEDESDKCYNYVVSKIKDFRNFGNACLDSDFATKYKSSKGEIDISNPYKHLLDVANTIENWLEYTQLAVREEKKLVILDDKKDEVSKILSSNPTFIDKPDNHENFQRKYGVDPKHNKDTRNLTTTSTITFKVLAEQQIRQAFISESLKKPIGKITSELIEIITEKTGLQPKLVEETLIKYYPHGAIGSFMNEYFEMAFKGKDNAVDFEKATVVLFNEAFGFETEHVGPIGLTPDVLLLSDEEGYIGILDNKAYSKYTISNDHKNRMIHNYIKTYRTGQKYPLAFFSYIAGGFGKNIDAQVKEIVDETTIHGSAISVSNVISLVDFYRTKGYNHKKIKEIFSLDRQAMLSDL